MAGSAKSGRSGSRSVDDERVHEEDPPLGIRELHQAEPLGIVVEAVGLGVDGDGRDAVELAG